MNCKQAKLRCENRHMVMWIESQVNEGDTIRFKGDTRWWLVEKTYWPTLDKGDIKHDWKVGGL